MAEQQIIQYCPVCRGTGKQITFPAGQNVSAETPCDLCKGTKEFVWGYIKKVSNG